MMKFKSKHWHWLSIGLLATAIACGDDDETTPDDNEEGEVITTVNLTFMPPTGPAVTASFFDPDGEGGTEGTFTPAATDGGFTLAAGTTYALSVEILNEEDPMDVEDVTEEIEEEAEEHQFFYVVTPDTILSVDITDVESDYENGNLEGDDFPVGLTADVEALAAGTGTLRVVLKHLPALDGGSTIQKTGTNTINDGESDFDLQFPVTVQ